MNTTDTLLMSSEYKPVYTMYDFMKSKGKIRLEDVVRRAYFKNRENAKPQYHGIDVLASDIRFEDESLLKNIDIKNVLESFIRRNGYKWLLVDMPPSNKTLNLICFSQVVDFVIVPFSSDIFSVNGYKHIIRTIQSARTHNAQLNTLGIYLARYDENSLGDKTIKERLERFGEMFINIQIPDRAELRDSTFTGRPISYYNTKLISASRSAYEKLVDYMSRKIEYYDRRK